MWLNTLWCSECFVISDWYHSPCLCWDPPSEDDSGRIALLGSGATHVVIQNICIARTWKQDSWGQGSPEGGSYARKEMCPFFLFIIDSLCHQFQYQHCTTQNINSDKNRMNDETISVPFIGFAISRGSTSHAHELHMVSTRHAPWDVFLNGVSILKQYNALPLKVSKYYFNYAFKAIQSLGSPYLGTSLLDLGPLNMFHIIDAPFVKKPDTVTDQQRNF